MFCPNCGNDCGNANFCPNCGTNLKGVVVTVSAADDTPHESPKKFRRYRYMPNELAAIKALRADTGMSLAEARQIIDDHFYEAVTKNPALTRAQKKADLNKSGQVYCPKCLSTSVSANPKGFGCVRGATDAADGMIAGGIGSKKVICTCLKCGHKWKVDKR